MNQPIDTESADRPLKLAISQWKKRIRGLAERRFVRNVMATFATRVFLIAVGLVTTVMVARVLGPTGRGLYAVATAVGLIGVQFGCLGMHTSNVYFVSRNRADLPKLLGNSLIVSLGVGAAVLVGSYAVFRAWPRLAPVHGALLLLGLLWIPIGTAYLLVQNLLLGVDQVGAFNLCEVINRVAALVIIALLVFGRQLSPALMFAAGLVAMTLSLGLMIRRLSKIANATPRPSWGLFRANLAYGLRAYLAAFFCFLVLRSDLLLLKYMRGAETAGYYSIAVAMTDYIAILPSITASLLLPKISATEDVRHKYLQMKKALIGTIAIMAPLLLISSALAPWVVRTLFGRAFSPSVSAYLWLMPGIFFLAVHTTSVQFLNSIGYPMSVIWVWLGCAILNVGLNLAWAIPRFGMDGAAITSSICYTIAALLILGVIRLELQRSSSRNSTLGEVQ